MLRCFSTGWAILFICIHQCCLHFRSIVFLQFNQLANLFHALEIDHKRKIKENVLITIPWNSFPGQRGHLPCKKKNSVFCLLPSFVWWAEREERYLEDTVRVRRKGFEYVGGKLLLEGQQEVVSGIHCGLIYTELSAWFWQLCPCISFPFRKPFLKIYDKNDS